MTTWGAGTAKSAEPELEVLIYNDAGVGNLMLEEALATAAQVFENAGVHFEPQVRRVKKDQAAETHPNATEADMRVLRLVSEGSPDGPSPKPGELGRAILRQDRGGWIAYVFPAHIERLSGARAQGLEAKLRFARLLGYTIAHELAHLLGIRHGDSGLMDRKWGTEDFEAMRFETLRLSAQEAAHVVTALAARPTAVGD